MSNNDEKSSKVQFSERPISPPRTDSRRLPPLIVPRSPRFAEATAVNSPIDKPIRKGVSTPTVHVMAQPQVSDVGFGYINKHESVEMPDTEYNPPLTAKTIPKTPLKSAMKTPGQPPRDFGGAILSPTFRQEAALEKREQHTEKRQARDVKVKTRVRMAKFFLRGVNFSCSLIVLAMLSSTFTIFNATKGLPPRNNLPPWAPSQKTWPQILMLCIACVSLAASVAVFYGYYKGGHRRASKAQTYYQMWAVCFFMFSIIMWGVGAAIMQHQRNTSNNKDMWGWSCVKNERQQLFQNEVQYELLCRLQNWSLLCAIIEIVVEVLSIIVYAIVFCRFMSKRKLRKSMAARDNARSNLYIAQLKSQPNTPALFTPAPYSARDGGWRPPMSAVDSSFKNATIVEEGDVQYIDADKRPAPQPFKLQPAPQRGTTPKMQQVGFQPMQTSASREPLRPLDPPSRESTPDFVIEDEEDADQHTPLMSATFPRHPFVSSPRQAPPQDHVGAAPGEEVYEHVPIPGAYEAPLSPGAEHFPRGPYSPRR